MDIITLITEYVEGLLAAEDKFIEHLDSFPELEKTVVELTNRMAAGFLGVVLTTADELICSSGTRKKDYTVQRKRLRTLISSVGDVTFTHTLYQDSEGKSHCLLDDQIHLPDRERFTTVAEAKILSEAQVHSYQHAADSIQSKNQTITKTTVMNKIHGISDAIPYIPPVEKKQCKYLFIEADEDHVAEQHGRWNDRVLNKSFMARLVYIYEYKQESSDCKGRKELVNKFYFGGLYSGKNELRKLWEEVQQYINTTFDTDTLKRVYISGDGAPWIKTGTTYIDKALFCADKFHLVKYINKASGQMLDEKDVAKSELYHLLYKKDRKGFREYTDQMLKSASNERAITDLQTYVLNNWAPTMRTLHDQVVDGCSAEGHVSSVLSDRLSSRPKGWSQTGADRMSRLRCYERNYGREKIIDLVRYSRQQRKLKSTGTVPKEIAELSAADFMYDKYSQAKSYIERMQATIPGITARKQSSIVFGMRLI